MEDSEELMANKADADTNREKLHSRVSYTNVFLCAELCIEENGQFFYVYSKIHFLFSDRRTAE